MDPDAHVPYLLSPAWLYAASALLLTYPYRVWAALFLSPRTFAFTKEISASASAAKKGGAGAVPAGVLPPSGSGVEKQAHAFSLPAEQFAKVSALWGEAQEANPLVQQRNDFMARLEETNAKRAAESKQMLADMQKEAAKGKGMGKKNIDHAVAAGTRPPIEFRGRARPLSRVLL